MWYRKLSRLLGFFCLILAGDCFGGSFLTEWTQQVNGTSPGINKGSEYGYMMGGSVSARVPTKSDPVFSAQGPKFAIGCGGVDIFLGSFAMANQEYLVAKAERMINQAPFVAFDMALKTLCQSCSQTMKDLNAALDRFNSLQLDECQSTKAILAYAADPLVDDPNLGEEVQRWKQSSGATSFWHGSADDIRADGGKVTTAQVDEMLAGCPKAVRDVFGQSGSVLAHLGEKLGYPESHTNAVRGIHGDIIVIKKDGYQVKYDPPCGAGGLVSLEDFIAGHVAQKVVENDDITTTCTDIKQRNEGMDEDLVTHSGRVLQQVQGKLRNRQALSNTEKAVIQSSGLPLQRLMKIGVSTRMEEALVSEVSRLLAMDQAYRMLSDLTAIADQSANVAMQIASTMGEQPVDCRVRIMAGAIQGFEKIKQSAAKANERIGKEYSAALAQSQDRLSQLAAMADMQDKHNKETSDKVVRGKSFQLGAGK